MSRPEIVRALDALPSIPRDRDGPVFAEPWHAQVFALAVALEADGAFTWSEWAERLGAEIAAQGPQACGEEAYYAAWLSALERLTAAKGIVPEPERAAREAAWDRAARATPRGSPIELENDPAIADVR